MNIFFSYLFYISFFIIFWAMIGYPFSLKILKKFYTHKKNGKNYNNKPKVTIMVVAHNEEKVIKNKLENLLSLEYPKDKLEILVSSDNSTDKTNSIVKDFIKNNPEYNIRLYEVKKRMGKTNAQNEAHKTVKTEFLVMTDANSLLEKNSITELMASFVSEDIAYVTGKLVIVNKDINDISNAENTYWDSDIEMREIESNIQTITAGNGALYACRTKEYYDFNPIECHDSAMPVYYALKNKRAIANHDAIAYEKAGENVEDEFKRKVRMNRVLLKHILPSLKILNFFKYKWFTYFYLGHRTARYLLWLSHLLLFVSNIFLINETLFFLFFLIGQITFYILAFIKKITGSNNKYLTLIYYYTITVLAQWVGVFNIITGKAKPFWEKAESTR